MLVIDFPYKESVWLAFLPNIFLFFVSVDTTKFMPKQERVLYDYFFFIDLGYGIVRLAFLVYGGQPGVLILHCGTILCA